MDNRRKLQFVTFLTVVRFPLVLLFFAFAIVHANTERTAFFVLAFVSLIVSAVTDLFDGYFARRFEVETPFGAHVDPLMDKFFYLATFPLLVYVAAANGHMQHAVILVILTMLFLTRDQWVTFLRSIGSLYSAEGGANWAGKLRTAILFPLICAIYFHEEAPVRWIGRPAVLVFEGVALLVNFVSLHVYTRRYWPYLRKSADLQQNAE
jgi:CDP-diacylglycerol--glycerol-3-phosphate 3-phosphatidyltransferase